MSDKPKWAKYVDVAGTRYWVTVDEGRGDRENYYISISQKYLTGKGDTRRITILPVQAPSVALLLLAGIEEAVKLQYGIGSFMRPRFELARSLDEDPFVPGELEPQVREPGGKKGKKDDKLDLWPTCPGCGAMPDLVAMEKFHQDGTGCIKIDWIGTEKERIRLACTSCGWVPPITGDLEQGPSKHANVGGTPMAVFDAGQGGFELWSPYAR